MQKAIYRIKHIKANIKLEQIYNFLLSSIIVIILSFSMVALYRPITAQQYKNIYQIAHKSNYMETQEMALALLGQDQIRVGQYLKLMTALQVESNQAKQLPPISLEEY